MTEAELDAQVIAAATGLDSAWLVRSIGEARAPLRDGEGPIVLRLPVHNASFVLRARTRWPEGKSRD